MAPALIIFGGLPGAGKTAIAKELARHQGGVYLRIDSIEQAIRDSGVASKSLDDEGYRVSYAVAEDNLPARSNCDRRLRESTSTHP